MDSCFGFVYVCSFLRIYNLYHKCCLLPAEKRYGAYIPAGVWSLGAWLPKRLMVL